MTEPRDPITDWLATQYIEPLAPPPNSFDRIERTAGRRRLIKAVGSGAAALTVILVAFIGGGQVLDINRAQRQVPFATQPVTPAPAPSNSPSHTPAPRVTNTDPTGTMSESTTETPDAARACRTPDLTITRIIDPAGGSAGHHDEFLRFTNTSDSPCTLNGYPGVSFVAGDDGAQINDAFPRTGQQHRRIALAVNATAHATLRIANIVNAENCRPVDVRGYRVYPPEQTRSVFVAAPQQACSTNGQAVPQVAPILPGAGE